MMCPDTGWQTVGRAMQPITTMMPVWQCGHARKDRPVSASIAIAIVSGRIGAGPAGAIAEQFPAARQLPRTMAVAEEAVVPDAVKPVRQHMDQEAADELPAVQGHRLLAVAVPVILPAEADLAVVHGHQAVVGDGDTVGIPPDIVENLCRPGEGPLRVDHPLGVPNRRQVTPERGGLMEVAVRGEEVQLTGGERLLQVVQEQAPEHPRQHPDRQEEPRPAGDPAFAVRCDPAARNKKMHVRVVQQVLPPGVQHAQEADLRAEMLWVGGDLAQRLRRRPEQDVVDHGLVLERDGGDQRPAR